MLLKLMFLIFGVGLLAVVENQSQSSIECKDQETCKDCLQLAGNCSWCWAPDFKDTEGKTLDRCFSLDEIGAKLACDENYLIAPNSQIKFLGNQELEGGQNTIQLQPQHVKIKLRRSQPYNLSVTFRLAENYPIDMYYLMDLSYSMADDKETVAQLGAELIAEMRKRTTNFRIGFGSFVDKVTLPYVSTTPQKLMNPCGEKEESLSCAPPFSFRHTLSLTSDAERFKTEVEKAAVSGNLDAPEGGFDGIMQVAVCGDKIGWRKAARKLLMFSTDASFHFAGDGKLAGIFEPHDGECHLSDQGEYTHDTLLDYPSIAQINSKVTEKSIAVIFAVTQGQVKDYERLSDQIQGSTCGELSANSSNVIQLVNQEYEKITSEVKLSHSLDEGYSPVKIKLFSHCGEGSEVIDGGRCGGVKIGQTVSFTAQMVLSDCPTKREDWSKSFVIRVLGIEEELVVDLDFICACDCEDPSHPGYEKLSHSCGLVGTLQCGACDCGSDYYGNFCECSTENTEILTEVTKNFNSGCREPNSTVDCSDRGECFCNRCDCRKLPNSELSYYGKYCQCDSLSCRRVNGFLCSGLEHGKCVCGDCQCDSDWSGSACECSTSTTKCRRGGLTTTGPECNGHGRCECNRCTCEADYSGPLCEECENCPDSCSDMANCVLCTVHRNTSNSDTCSTACILYQQIDSVEFAPTTEGKYCTAVDESDGCNFYYSYTYDPQTNDIQIKAQEAKSCPLLVQAGWVIGGSIVIGILLLGLIALFLLWWYRDKEAKKEYARFNDEKIRAKWDRMENPLYRNPNTTFRNPLHESNQKEKFN